MRPLAWLIVAAALIQGTTALGSETLTCSTFQGIGTCSSPDGYVSHETQWQGFTIGDDNQGGIRLLAPPVARLPAISLKREGFCRFWRGLVSY